MTEDIERRLALLEDFVESVRGNFTELKVLPVNPKNGMICSFYPNAATGNRNGLYRYRDGSWVKI